MNRIRIKQEDLIFSDIHIKFGVEYREAVFKNESFGALFPWFLSFEPLNLKVLDVVNAYCHDNGSIKFKLVYADEKYVSMTINNVFSVNYSIPDKALLPTDLLLKEKNIKKRSVIKASRNVSKHCKVLYDTLRLANGGIRIDVVDKNKTEKYTVRVSPSKK